MTAFRKAIIVFYILLVTVLVAVPLLDGLGLSGAGAHTLEEFILIEDIPKRATLLTKLILES